MWRQKPREGTPEADAFYTSREEALFRGADGVRMKRSGLIALVALASLSAGCGPIDWPTFGFDIAHTRATSDTAPSLQTVADLNRAWIGITGGAGSSSPVIAGGNVYVASTDGHLYVYDAIDRGNCSWGTLCSPRWSAVI